MSRTTGYHIQDLAFPDGQIFVSPVAAIPSQNNLTRGGKGLVHNDINGAATGTFTFILNSLLFRYGMQDDAQQYFGMGAPVGGFQGAQAQPTPPAQFTTPWGPTGRPPFPASSFGVPVTSRPKGIQINSIDIYNRNGANPLATFTIGLSKSKFNPAADPTITDLLPVGQNGVALAATATPIITRINLPTAAQIMLTDTTSEYILELVFGVAAASFVNYYGAFLNVSYNFN